MHEEATTAQRREKGAQRERRLSSALLLELSGTFNPNEGFLTALTQE